MVKRIIAVLSAVVLMFSLGVVGAGSASAVVNKTAVTSCTVPNTKSDRSDSPTTYSIIVYYRDYGVNVQPYQLTVTSRTVKGNSDSLYFSGVLMGKNTRNVSPVWTLNEWNDPESISLNFPQADYYTIVGDTRNDTASGGYVYCATNGPTGRPGDLLYIT